MKAIRISGQVAFDFTTVMSISEDEWEKLQEQKERWIFLGEENTIAPHLIKALDPTHLKDIRIIDMADMSKGPETSSYRKEGE